MPFSKIQENQAIYIPNKVMEALDAKKGGFISFMKKGKEMLLKYSDENPEEGW